MRAVRFEQFGEPADVLRVEDMTLPEPGPGQVRVRMRVRPINPSDLFMIRGTYGLLPRLPATPGFEGAGHIDALGAGVAGLRAGQLVAPTAAVGTWQESLIADQHALIEVPPGLSERQAAMLLVNPTTAWIMLNDTLRVKPGEWLIQNAGNSAVGRFVIAIARTQGIRTISVVRRPELADELRALGADEVICDADQDVVERAKAVTGGKGPRYALDSVAGASGSALARALAPGGRMLVFGTISREPLSLDGGAMLFRGISVQGWWLSQWFRAASREQVRALYDAILPLIENGTLTVPIAAEFGLEEVHAACAMADGSARNGKVLLVG
jgi:NADPH:quinone reductase-like Zn-dependent oxidoreductase